MIKKKKLILVFLAVFLQIEALFACEYNIRDTGFVDLGFYRYQLYCYVNDNTTNDITTCFQKTVKVALTETNIQPQIVNIDRQKKHPAIKYINQWGIKSFPAAILVSPDNNSIPVNIFKSGQPFEQTLQAAITGIVSSPLCRQILKRIDKAMAVILLIEGKEPQENEKVRQIATDAIESIVRQMKLMPKFIEDQPALIIIEQQFLSAERSFLWSLGLDTDRITEPVVAVLYARARLMGPVLKGKMITKNILTNIVAVIGADCECGLDRRWMRGRILPVKWDADMQTRVAKSLGFDPENPMVKLDVSRILKYDINEDNLSWDPKFLSNMPVGSRELKIDFDFNRNIAENQNLNNKGKNAIRTMKKQVELRNDTLLNDGIYLRRSLYLGCGISALVIFSGVFIIIKGLRKKL